MHGIGRAGEGAAAGGDTSGRLREERQRRRERRRGDGEDDGRESTGFSIDDLVAEDADDDDVGAGYTRGGGVAA